MNKTVSNEKTPLENQKEVDAYMKRREASLEPLSDKEVNDFLERQRRAAEDSKWSTAKTIKEIKKDTYTICKIDSRMSRKGWVSYGCEIRKGSSRGKTVCWVDQAGEGGSEFIDINHKLFSKDELDKIENYIYENCESLWIKNKIEEYLMVNDLQTCTNDDPKLREYLLPYKNVFINKDIDEMPVESLIGWWTEDTANNKYYS